MASDLVDPLRSLENMQVHYNIRQKWYYLSHQTPSELLVFKSADSRSREGVVPPGKAGSNCLDSEHSPFDYCLGTPHSSFNNPNFSPGDFLRESFEMRVLVTY
jgi:hypothetical protein